MDTLRTDIDTSLIDEHMEFLVPSRLRQVRKHLESCEDGVSKPPLQSLKPTHIGLFDYVTQSCSNQCSHGYSTTTYEDGGEGFIHTDVKGREIIGDLDSYPVSGFNVEFTDISGYDDYYGLISLFTYITGGGWIDAQTSMISIESNLLHKLSGVYGMSYTMLGTFLSQLMIYI